MTDNYDPNSIFGAYRVPKTNVNTDYGPTTAPPSTAGWSMGEAGPIGSAVAPASAYNPPNMGDPGGTDWVSVLAQRRRNLMNQATQQQQGGAASQMVMEQAQGGLPGWTPGETFNGRLTGWNTPGGGFVPNEEGSGLVPGAPPNPPANPAAFGTVAPPAAVAPPGAAAPFDLRTASMNAGRALEGQMPTMNGVPYTPEMQNQWAGWGGVAGGPAAPGGYTTGPFPGAPQGGGAGNAVPVAPPAAVAPPTAGGTAPGAVTPEQGAAQTYTAVKQHLMQLLASGQAAQAQQLISSIRGY